MKNLKHFIFLITGFMLIIGSVFSLGLPVFAETKPLTIKIILETSIYSSYSIKSEQLTKDTVKIVLKTDTRLEVDKTFETENPTESKTFYRVVLTNISNDQNLPKGYILKSHALNSNVNSPAKKLVPNATVKNDNAIIYNKTLNPDTNKYEFTKTTTVLKKGTKVKILDGYNKKKDFTYISFLNENNDIVSLYIKTSDLHVKGINYSIIVAIIILLACIGIICAVFGVRAKINKNKNKHKKAKKTK